MDMPGMKTEGRMKGGGRKEMLREALDNVRRMIDAEDMAAIDARAAPPPTEEPMESGEGMEVECEECKNGTCTDPDHNEDAMREMVAGMGGD